MSKVFNYNSSILANATGFSIIINMKPLAKVKKEWSPNFAYAIGLITTDGSLSSDGRHINFTSKDLELALLFKKALGLNNSIGKKARAHETEKKYYVIQFGDVVFYKYLVNIGLTPNKSKTVGSLKIPDKYYFDFLRGCIDGDGNIRHFKHPESQYHQLRVRLTSASITFLEWVKKQNASRGINGFLTKAIRAYNLEYAIEDSIKLLNAVYYQGFQLALKRKLIKAKPYLCGRGGTGRRVSFRS